ncbi:MAG: DUF512 domain-containing protein [Oscillospiraceae bacterium]|nr:DUF512 domain-containing protein [Oscillospiraceae bacterium]
MTEIIRIAPGSPADGKIAPGDFLVAINGTPIADVLDYQFHSYDAALSVTIETPTGERRTVSVQKQEGQDLGLDFADYLMDQSRSCQNRCIFCFIDQLPPGLRETLYFKDDDIRLSFLTGNYISLTNLSDQDLDRMIHLRISPINISVHATDPTVRTRMLGNPRAGRCMELMRRFADAGIRMNAQLVLCPTVNDGAVLAQSMPDLAGLWPQLQSVSVVPVGLTRYRDDLCPLTAFTSETAHAAVKQVEQFAAECLTKHGSRIFFCGDELYLKSGLPLPSEDAYEGYPQLENGVGLIRSFETEFLEALESMDPPHHSPAPFSIATGSAAAPFLQDYLATAEQICGKLDGQVHAIQNDFFGHTITVSGLVTGGDIRAQLQGRDLGKRLFLPRSMLRHGEGVFLDDMTVEELSAALGVPVIPVDVNGASFLDAIFE